MWGSKLKMNEENSKHAILAIKNAFGPAFFHRMQSLVKGQ
jgi:hypothetical protein